MYYEILFITSDIFLYTFIGRSTISGKDNYKFNPKKMANKAIGVPYVLLHCASIIKLSNIQSCGL